MTPGLKRHDSRVDTVSCLRKLADPPALLHVYTQKLPLFMEESLQQQLQQQKQRRQRRRWWRRRGLDLTSKQQPAIRTPLRGTLSGGDKV